MNFWRREDKWAEGIEQDIKNIHHDIVKLNKRLRELEAPNFVANAIAEAKRRGRQ